MKEVEIRDKNYETDLLKLITGKTGNRVQTPAEEIRMWNILHHLLD